MSTFKKSKFATKNSANSAKINKKATVKPHTHLSQPSAQHQNPQMVQQGDPNQNVQMNPNQGMGGQMGVDPNQGMGQ